MQKSACLLLVIAILASCGGGTENEKNLSAFAFRVILRPSFDESAEITVSKNKEKQEAVFLLMERDGNDRMTDTFYFKTINISNDLITQFKSEVIQKTVIPQPPQPQGVRDGMSVRYTLIENGDTSSLFFRNPNIARDTIGYKITKQVIENLRLIMADSIVSNYLSDVESYMDQTKDQIQFDENRPINKLRKIKYSR